MQKSGSMEDAAARRHQMDVPLDVDQKTQPICPATSPVRLPEDPRQAADPRRRSGRRIPSPLPKRAPARRLSLKRHVFDPGPWNPSRPPQFGSQASHGSGAFSHTRRAACVIQEPAIVASTSVVLPPCPRLACAGVVLRLSPKNEGYVATCTPRRGLAVKGESSNTI